MNDNMTTSQSNNDSNNVNNYNSNSNSNSMNPFRSAQFHPSHPHANAYKFAQQQQPQHAPPIPPLPPGVTMDTMMKQFAVHPHAFLHAASYHPSPARAGAGMPPPPPPYNPHVAMMAHLVPPSNSAGNGNAVVPPVHMHGMPPPVMHLHQPYPSHFMPPQSAQQQARSSSSQKPTPQRQSYKRPLVHPPTPHEMINNVHHNFRGGQSLMHHHLHGRMLPQTHPQQQQKQHNQQLHSTGGDVTDESNESNLASAYAARSFHSSNNNGNVSIMHSVKNAGSNRSSLGHGHGRKASHFRHAFTDIHTVRGSESLFSPNSHSSTARLREKQSGRVINPYGFDYYSHNFVDGIYDTTSSINQSKFVSSSNTIVPDPIATLPRSGVKVVGITEEQISEAIPKDASSIFHILDRRINFDAFPEDASFYSLLRAWVQDDPYRYIPKADLISKAKALSATKSSADNIVYPRIKWRATGAKLPQCDILSFFSYPAYYPKVQSIDYLRNELVQKARSVRAQAKKERAIIMKVAAEKLKKRGLHRILTADSSKGK